MHQVFIAKIAVVAFACLSFLLNQKIPFPDFTRTLFAYIIRFMKDNYEIPEMFPF